MNMSLSLVVVIRALIWGKTTALTPTPVHIEADKPAVVSLSTEIRALTSGAHIYLVPKTDSHVSLEDYVEMKRKETTPWGRIEHDEISIVAKGDSTEVFSYVGMTYSKEPALIFRRTEGTPTDKGWSEITVYSSIELGPTKAYWKNYEL